MSITSPFTRPSPHFGRVGIRIMDFEACSGFTRVTARWIARPPEAAFVTRLRPVRFPSKPLVSYQINRQLSGRNPPPLVTRAFGAHQNEAVLDSAASYAREVAPAARTAALTGPLNKPADWHLWRTRERMTGDLVFSSRHYIENGGGPWRARRDRLSPRTLRLVHRCLWYFGNARSHSS